MKRLLQILIIISILALCACSAQKRAHDTSSGRAAYGNTPDFRANKKKNKKAKKKSRKSAKRKKAKNDRSSVFTGRPY